jgi:hypothetical protein
MDIRQVREYLGRVKPYYLKNETLRALAALISGLKGALGMPGGIPTPVRGSIREAVQLMARDEMVKKRLPVQLMYQQGQERQLLVLLAKLHKEIDEELNREDYDTAKTRKQSLDHTMNQGLRSLEGGRVSEADEYFHEALKFYRDEHRLFFYIAKSLVDAGAAKRALPYLKKGLELAPGDAEMTALLDRANQLIREAQ